MGWRVLCCQNKDRLKNDVEQLSRKMHEIHILRKIEAEISCRRKDDDCAVLKTFGENAQKRDRGHK